MRVHTDSPDVLAAIDEEIQTQTEDPASPGALFHARQSARALGAAVSGQFAVPAPGPLVRSLAVEVEMQAGALAEAISGGDPEGLARAARRAQVAAAVLAQIGDQSPRACAW